jgi:hypothetical protein
MTTDPTTAPISGAFLLLLHHVVFEMTPEQAAALVADDEPCTDRLLLPAERKGRNVGLRYASPPWLASFESWEQR